MAATSGRSAQPVRELDEEVAALESQIHQLESRYLTAVCNAVSGWSAFNRTLQAKPQVVADKTRVFSLSSRTSPLGAVAWPADLALAVLSSSATAAASAKAK